MEIPVCVVPIKRFIPSGSIPLKGNLFLLLYEHCINLEGGKKFMEQAEVSKGRNMKNRIVLKTRHSGIVEQRGRL